MSRFWLPGLIVASIVVNASHADEKKGEKLPPPMTETPAPLPAPVVEAAPATPGCATCGQTISRQKVTLIEEQSAATRDILVLRESVMAQAAPGIEVVFREERQTVTEMVLVPHETEQVVVVNRVKEVTTVDPATGKPCVHFEPYQETVKVKIAGFELVPQPREVVVRVPCIKPVEQVVLVKKLCAYPTTQAVIETRLKAEVTPFDLQAPACPMVGPMPCPGAGCGAK